MKHSQRSTTTSGPQSAAVTKSEEEISLLHDKCLITLKKIDGDLCQGNDGTELLHELCQHFANLMLYMQNNPIADLKFFNQSTSETAQCIIDLLRPADLFPKFLAGLIPYIDKTLIESLPNSGHVSCEMPAKVASQVNEYFNALYKHHELLASKWTEIATLTRQAEQACTLLLDYRSLSDAECATYACSLEALVSIRDLLVIVKPYIPEICDHMRRMIGQTTCPKLRTEMQAMVRRCEPIRLTPYITITEIQTRIMVLFNPGPGFKIKTQIPKIPTLWSEFHDHFKAMDLVTLLQLEQTDDIYYRYLMFIIKCLYHDCTLSSRMISYQDAGAKHKETIQPYDPNRFL
jgi:hypothetical protein